ncbi:MAG: hypothetical protein B7X32_16620 [Microbacterium sp. 13-71-7]|nr:MAG: hypothetical protein B7X32_16620 [Microbacterium sp. 13-71-7]
MIIGTGIDLVDIPRFERTVARTPRLMQRLFAPSEQALRLPSLAARYAAKEALIKALGGSDGVHWTEIEIASEPSGRPYFVLSGSTAAAVAERGITTLHLSLTHDAGLASAYVVAESRESAAAPAGGSAPAGAGAGSVDAPSERPSPLADAHLSGGADPAGGPRQDRAGEERA